MVAEPSLWSSAGWDGIDDTVLLGYAAEGVPEAYGELWRRHLPAAYAVAHAHRNRASAEDIVADASSRVFGLIQSGKGPTTNFRSYFLSAVKTSAVDSARTDLRVVPTADEQLHEATESVSPPDLSNALDKALVGQAFAALNEGDQRVLWHTAIEGETPREAATKLGLTANGVSVRAMRARDHLRDRYLDALALQWLPKADSEECEYAISNMGAFVREKLPKRKDARVAAHVEGCPRAAAVMEELLSASANFPALLVPIAFLGAASVPGLITLGAAGAAAAPASSNSSDSSSNAAMLAAVGAWGPRLVAAAASVSVIAGVAAAAGDGPSVVAGNASPQNPSASGSAGAGASGAGASGAGASGGATAPTASSSATTSAAASSSVVVPPSTSQTSTATRPRTTYTGSSTTTPVVKPTTNTPTTTRPTNGGSSGQSPTTTRQTGRPTTKPPKTNKPTTPVVPKTSTPVTTPPTTAVTTPPTTPVTTPPTTAVTTPGVASPWATISMGLQPTVEAAVNYDLLLTTGSAAATVTSHDPLVSAKMVSVSGAPGGSANCSTQDPPPPPASTPTGTATAAVTAGLTSALTADVVTCLHVPTAGLLTVQIYRTSADPLPAGPLVQVDVTITADDGTTAIATAYIDPTQISAP